MARMKEYMEEQQAYVNRLFKQVNMHADLGQTDTAMEVLEQAVQEWEELDAIQKTLAVED